MERDERQFGVEDVDAIKNNAWRESMGLEIQQSDLILDGASNVKLKAKNFCPYQFQFSLNFIAIIEFMFLTC